MATLNTIYENQFSTLKILKKWRKKEEQKKWERLFVQSAPCLFWLLNCIELSTTASTFNWFDIAFAESSFVVVECFCGDDSILS